MKGRSSALFSDPPGALESSRARPLQTIDDTQSETVSGFPPRVGR